MIEFFFDCSSPWTYVAFTNIQPLMKKYGEPITWRPFLVGGVFNAANMQTYEVRSNLPPAKAAYGKKDLADWARLAGITIHMPPKIFPVNAVKSMRGCCWVQMTHPDLLLPYAKRVFESYWTEQLDISQDDVLAEICKQVGLDPAAFFAGISEQAVKDKLKANTDEAIARGAFGSPTIYLDKTDMYFGNDRLPLIEAALQRRAPTAA
jgi:2-hydroxychromene-2-carboxylate isomerase